MIRGYIAMSADGFIADGNGGVGWLEPFGSVDYGFESFFASVDTVVIGRRTFDQVLSFGGTYPYAAKKNFVVTSSPLPEALSSVEAWSGSISSLAETLDGLGGDSWIVGGPMLQSSFLSAGLLDRLELFVMPVMLGSGEPLHKGQHMPLQLRLEDVYRFDKGIIKLDYRLER